MAENVFACVWQSGRDGGGGHDDNSSEASATKEQSVCIVDKLGSARVGHSLGSLAQCGSGIKLLLLWFSLLRFY